MSAILRNAGRRAFAAQRSATSLSTIAAAPARRSFSGFSKLRSSIRAIEPHPFNRVPTTTMAAKADWSKSIKHITDAAMFFVPANILFFGWPFAAQYMLQGRM